MIAFLLALLYSFHTESVVPKVVVEQTDIEQRGTQIGPRDYATFLVRNDTEEKIKVFEVRVCYGETKCELRYVVGEFVPGSSSWSSELDATPGKRLSSITLTKVQSVEVQ